MFQHLQSAPPDPIFSVVEAFRADPNPDKVNLSIGVYTDENGNPFVFDTVAKAARQVSTKNFNYMPMQGDATFLRNTKRLYFGDAAHILACQQTCGGTHALSIFSRFVEESVGEVDVLVGTPTWGNYFQIFEKHNLVTFPHVTEGSEVNIDAYVEACEHARENSVLLLQGGDTHNPTGKNLSMKDLDRLFPIIEKKNIFVFVDFAYLGFGAGFKDDRLFLSHVFDHVEEAACGVSYSKNASLYKHRTGALFIKSKTEERKQVMESHLQYIIRQTVSNLPAYGSDIINILFDTYFDEWSREVDDARGSIDARRNALARELPKAFSHISDTRGMFGLLGISKERVMHLRKSASIYLLDSGRINFAGIQTKDIPKIALYLKKGA